MAKEVKRVSKSKESGINKLFFNHPIAKFFGLVIIYIILTNISGYFNENIPIRLILNIIEILIAIYFVIVIIYLIRRSINQLINPENIFRLILSYALFILGIILLFSTLFNIVELTKTGYLTYGTCSDKFNSSMISTDSQISRNFFYFASLTFFTVGYGDICPMGFDKTLAIITAFIGHLVAVVVVALILNNYLRKRENYPK